MQILQQIPEYWPMLVALWLALRHELQHEFTRLAPVILAVETALIAGAAVVTAKVRAAAFFPMLLFALFPFLMRLETRNRDPNSARLPLRCEEDHARRRS